MKIKFYRAYIWILLGLVAVGVKSVTTAHPVWIEKYYSLGFYQWIRSVFDYSFSVFPFPAIYLFFAILALITGFEVRKLILSIRKKEWSFSRSLRKTVAFIGGLVFLFFLLWGFNYNRVEVEDHMGLEVQPLSIRGLKSELELETKELIALRSLIVNVSDSSALERQHFPEDLEVHLRENLSKTLTQYKYPGEGQIRGRLLYPKGIFLRFSSAGLYFPFVGEGNIDAGLHPIQWPYVMTHEMAHGFGFADEGTCNFWAYLSCTASPHPAVAYAGHLSYWRSLAIQYQRYEPEAYRTFRQTLPLGIIADLDRVNQEMDKYPDFVPHLQPQMYNAYLKAQGIHEGLLNYKRVIMLVHAWRKAWKS
ncbi:MAG TPA: DUF3810 domain-containing protein [Saprospiraceae bacterium]|nr:DUF3810 domain-containing protein [Saprospiraceae bacterium]